MKNDRFEEMKRVIFVYLKDRINKYIETQEKVLREEEGYFSPSLKAKVTNFKKEVIKLEENLPDEKCYSDRNVNKVQKLLFDVYFRKACKMDNGEVSDEVIPIETIKEKFGEQGYQLMTDYVAIKSGIMCLVTEIKKEKRVEAEKMLHKFEQLKRFLEYEVLI